MNLLKKLNWKQIMVLITMMLTATMFCGEYLISKTLPVSGDGFFYLLEKVSLHDCIKEGEFPFWNPYVSIGKPYFSGTLDPFNILFIIFDTTTAYNIFRIIQLFLAGMLMFGLMRQLEVNELVSWLIGISYMGSVIMGGSRIEHPSLQTTFALFPGLIFLLEKFRETRKYQWLIYTDVLMAIQYCSGFAQIVLYFDIVLFLYLLDIFLELKCSIREAVKCLFVWSTIYILLISVQMLPLMNMSRLSARGEKNYEFFSSLSYDLRILIQAILPGVTENKYMVFESASSGIDIEIYIGILFLMFAIYGVLVNFKESRTVKRFTVLLIGCFIFGMVPHIPLLGKIVFHMPILGNFRVCARSLPIAIFFTIILAGIGLYNYFEKKMQQQVFLKIIFGFVLILFVGYVTLWQRGILVDDIGSLNRIKKCIGIALTLSGCGLFISLFGFLSKKHLVCGLLCFIIVSINFADVSRFSIADYRRKNNFEELCFSDDNHILEAVRSNTIGHYRSFIAAGTENQWTDANLRMKRYNGGLNENIYNSYSSFKDKRLKYWALDEDCFYPRLLNSISQNTDVISMIGLRRIYDAWGHNFPIEVPDDEVQGRIVFESDQVLLEKAGNTYSTYFDADWIKENTAYKVTLKLKGEPSVLYTDYYTDTFEKGNNFRELGDKEYVSYLSTEDVPTEGVVCRIIAQSDEDITIEGVSIQEIGKKKVFEKKRYDGIDVYKNLDANKIVYVADKVMLVENFGNSADGDGLVHPNMISYIEGSPSEAAVISSAKVRQIKEHRNRIECTVDVDGEVAFINHAQLFYPWWNVYVDGRKQENYCVNNLMQGTYVSRGQHHVEWVYQPVDVYCGGFLTLLGICGCVIILKRNKDLQG